ncbi:tail spike [Bacillus phage 268TH004]|uniref:Tail spike n=1 Tax=Bacillus phage 268TH004 TaxID=2801523 RepID=A0A7T7ZAL2_9CAUD|nr:tail spike [Bacillus phage 268TH004]
MNTYELEIDRWGISSGGSNPIETTQGFNDAIQYAKTEGYAEIFVPKGHYLIDCVSKFGSRPEYGGGIRLVSDLNVTLHPEATFKVLANDATGYSLFYLELIENVTIKGGRIYGDRYEHTYTYYNDNTETHEWGYGIHVRGSRNIYIKNVFVADCTGDNIWIAAHGMMNWTTPYTPARDVTVSKCTLIRGRRNCLATNGCEGLLVDDCAIEDAGGEGGTRPQYGIDLEGFGESGIKYDHPYKLVVRNCKFKGNALGDISSFTAGKVIIEGNTCENVISYGYSTDILIENNLIINEGEVKPYGIDSLGVSSTETGNRATIKGNTIRGFNIGINAKGKGVLVESNTLENISAVAIQVYQATDALIANNRVDSDCIHFQALLAENTLFAGNKSEGNSKDYAYKITNSKGITFTGNELTEGYGGYYVQGSLRSKIISNTLQLVGAGMGIYWGVNSEVEAKGNTIEAGSGVPIMGYADLYKAIIKDNTVKGCQAVYAVYLKGGKRHNIESNILEIARNADYGYGVYIEGTSGVKLKNNSVEVTNDRGLTSSFYTEKSTDSLVVMNDYNKGVIKSHETDTVENNYLV